MSKSLFERTKFKLGYNAEIGKNWTWTYSRSWHVYFFGKGTRGGISYISNRYSKASNKYLKSYDLNQESKYIIYLHLNGHLYT